MPTAIFDKIRNILPDTDDFDKRYNIPGFIWMGVDSIVLHIASYAAHIYHQGISLDHVYQLAHAVEQTKQVFDGRILAVKPGLHLKLEIISIDDVQVVNERVVTLSKFVSGKTVDTISDRDLYERLRDLLKELSAEIAKAIDYSGVDLQEMNVKIELPFLNFGTGKLIIVDLCGGITKLRKKRND